VQAIYTSTDSLVASAFAAPPSAPTTAGRLMVIGRIRNDYDDYLGTGERSTRDEIRFAGAGTVPCPRQLVAGEGAQATGYSADRR
jgi:hypothetical protein